MKTTKNSRSGSPVDSSAVSPAASSPTQLTKVVNEEVIATSIRLPKSMHDALRMIVFEEGNRGNRVSIHSLILEGIEKVIKKKT